MLFLVGYWFVLALAVSLMLGPVLHAAAGGLPRDLDVSELFSPACIQ
jgi:hypothetical protein